MRPSVYLLIIVTLLFGTSACSRERVRRNSSQPTNTETIAVIQSPKNQTVTPTLAIEMTPSYATPSPLTLPLATSTNEPVPTQASAAAKTAAELEAILSDLEQLIGNTDTNVTIP